MIPAYKIVTLTGAVEDYSITQDADNIRFSEVLTNSVGTFGFTLPTKKGTGYVYNDITLHDKVKIYVGWDSVPANPNFIGYITRIEGPLSTEAGFVRRFTGLSQGEILRRRFKTDTYWGATEVDDIVDAVATDLSLGKTDIATETNTINYEVETKRYMDILKDISDYWISAGTQLKYDFYVDTDNDLVWKARPIRSSGVETLTVGQNILSYNVVRDVQSVKNNITVYGCAEKPLPADKDEWTESITNWTASAGTVAVDSSGPKVGTYDIEGHTGAAAAISTFKRDIPLTNIRSINKLFFWSYTAANITSGDVRLHAPDSSNYFEADLTVTDNTWHFHELNLGPNEEYDANENPNGTWTLTGSPNWWEIEYVEFHYVYGANDRYSHVDALWFYPDRWSDTASDGASQSLYGQRDYQLTDDKLHSDSDCQKRGETLLFQLKSPPVQIEVVTNGNDNILVGDRLSMTIPAENISAANYDVFKVENALSTQKNAGWTTRALMVNSADYRKPIPRGAHEVLREVNTNLRDLAVGDKRIR